MDRRRALQAIALLPYVAACAVVPGTGGPLLPAPPPVWPLRGTEAPSRDAIRRRPIVARIDNAIDARPQSGLAAADMVWEMLVEGGITRYAVVYHAQDAQQLGPVRSARLSDLHLLPMFRGILAHVGAQTTVLQRIRDAAKSGAFIDVDQITNGAAYDRIRTRRAPFNVYTSTQRLREAARDTGGVDVPPLAFGDLEAASPSPSPTAPVAATTITIPYRSVQRVAYAYDPSANAYKRTQNGVVTTDAATSQEVRPDNVVVIKTDITEVQGIIEDEFGSRSLEVRTTGTGPLSVFRDGRRLDGTWSRQGTEMFHFTADSGAGLRLRPGLTWVHVIPMDLNVQAS